MTNENLTEKAIPKYNNAKLKGFHFIFSRYVGTKDRPLPLYPFNKDKK